MRRNLIRPETIVECDLEIVDTSRRNRNYRVVSQNSRSYLLKQGIADGATTVACEAATLCDLLSDQRMEGLRRYLPAYYGFDPERGVLILELLRHAESLREYHFRLGRFPLALARKLGDALGILHAAPVGMAAPHFARRPAWILSVHRPDVSFFREVSSANLELIKLLQGSPLCGEALDTLREGWTPDALIHRDIKADNLVVFAREDSRRKSRLALVDWELAGVGDACWDVGSVFSEYLATWLLSMPTAGEIPPFGLTELARFPLERIHPAIRAFWDAYVDRMRFDVRTSRQRLIRSVQYSAARLIQTCYESSHASAHLVGTTQCMLQLSQNVLQRPLEACVHLLGIQLSDNGSI
jgi:hypothetical protein